MSEKLLACEWCVSMAQFRQHCQRRKTYMILTGVSAVVGTAVIGWVATLPDGWLKGTLLVLIGLLTLTSASVCFEHTQSACTVYKDEQGQFHLHPVHTERLHRAIFPLSHPHPIGAAELHLEFGLYPCNYLMGRAMKHWRISVEDDYIICTDNHGETRRFLYIDRFDDSWAFKVSNIDEFLSFVDTQQFVNPSN